MSSKPAVVLSATKMLNVGFRRRVLDYLAQDACTINDRLADAQAIDRLKQQNAREFQPSADFSFSVIDLHDIAFAHPILPRTIFEHCVHHSLRA